MIKKLFLLLGWAGMFGSLAAASYSWFGIRPRLQKLTNGKGFSDDRFTGCSSGRFFRLATGRLLAARGCSLSIKTIEVGNGLVTSNRAFVTGRKGLPALVPFSK